MIKKKLKVLLVEDVPIAAIGTQALLESKGIEAVWASTGQAAIEALKNKFDFILLDLGLPDMDGYNIINYLHRQKGNIAKTPIIILSAHDDNQHRQLAKEMKVHGYLSKPIRSEDCDKLIEEFS